MAIKERKCLSCATEYKYCPNCSRVDALKPAWASQFCSESCMTLWTTLTKFGMNHLTKSEAKEIISELDLDPIDTYVACVQRDYAKVMAEEKKPKRNRKSEMKILDEAMEVKPEVAVPVVTEIVEIKPEQQIEVAEQVTTEVAAYEVVLEEKE